jgi:hypothetical protein
MKQALLCLCVAIALTGCNKSEDEEESKATPATTPRPVAKTATPTASPTATPKSNDWMWKKADGKTSKDTDPFKIKSDALDQKAKK